MKSKLNNLFVFQNRTIRDALEALNDTAEGILLLIDYNGKLLRTVTDGDLRRLILTGCSLVDTLESLPEKKPIVASYLDVPISLLAEMNRNGINHIVLVDSDYKPTGIALRGDIDKSILLSSPHMGDEEQNFVAQAFDTNWIAPVGPNVDAFEQELAGKVGSSYAVALSSGTAAIHLALRVLGVERGDVVFCSTFTFVASVNPILYQGATPLFIDSEPESWNMSSSALERALIDSSQKGMLPKAVIVVNLYGQSADFDKIIDLCDKYGVPVVEDAAESLGATYKGRASGTIGKIGIYSFNGNKIITTSSGGMLVTNDESLAVKAKFLSTQAREPVGWYEHKEIGYNYRMSNILAGIGRGQLKVLEDRVNARRAVFEQYQNLLHDCVQIEWMPEAKFGRSNRWLTALSLKESNIDVGSIVKAISKENIEVRQLWKPMHRQPVFSEVKYYKHEEGKSISDELFKSGLCLPSGSNLTQAQVKRVASVLRNTLESM